MGAVGAMAGPLMFSPQGLCLGRPMPALPPPSFRRQGLPVTFGSPALTLTHPRSDGQGEGSGPPRGPPGATLQGSLAPGRQAPRAPDTPGHDCHFALCVGSWRAGPGSRTKGVQTRPTAKSKGSRAPWGRRLPGDQATSPLGWALNYSHRGQFRVIVCFP